MASANEIWEKKLQDPSATPMFLPLEFLKTITCDFSTEREIGKGGYGVVYKGVLSCGTIVAVKKLFNLHILGDEEFLKEISFLIGIRHQNVVQFVGYCAESYWEVVDQGTRKYVLAETPKRLLCFEYVCNGRLHEYISDASSGLEWSMRYELIRGICGGLHYLHEECRIIHMDLKPDNILIDATMVPKIADFGLSRIFCVEQSYIITQNNPGTPGYMAPEYAVQGRISIKADIYSLGIIIIEMLTGSRDYPLSGVPHFQQFSEDTPHSTDTSFQHFKEKILELWRNRLQSSQGDTLLEQVRVCAELGIQCTQFNPDMRPVTKYIIDRLDEVNIMDGSIKTGMSNNSAVAQEGETSDTPQQGDTSSEVIIPKKTRCRVEEHGGHRAKLTDVHEKTGAAKTKYGVKVPFHSNSNEGEPSTARVPSSADEATKHLVLESMLCDESVEPTCLKLSLLEDITNNFSGDQEIHRSPIGVVYKGKLSNGSTVVVKRLAIATVIGDKLFLHAVSSLISVKHNNIVRLLGYCANTHGKVTREGDKSVIVMVRERLLCFEYLCRGNLQMHLTDESRGFDWHTRYQAIKGICEGLHYLHDDSIPHLDLKTDTILFDEKMVPKILDYGLSRVFNEEIRRAVRKNIDGSLAYMATPEYLAGGEITLGSDIYCLGVIIIQIVTGKNKKNYSDIASIVESWRNRLELDESKGGYTFETCCHQVKVCIEIGICCMDHDPKNRLSTGDIIDKLNITEMEQSVGGDVSTSFPEQMVFPTKATLPPSGEDLKTAPVPQAPAAFKGVSKIELKVPITCTNCKSTIMQVLSKIEGIYSLGFCGNSTVTLVGKMDVAVVLAVLRKQKIGKQYCTECQSKHIIVHDQESDSCTTM